MRFRKQLIAFLSVLVLGGATLGAALAAPSSQSTEGDASEAPASESATAPDPKAYLGLAVQPLTEPIRERLELPADLEGVVIVRAHGPAAEAGLQRGDVILSAGGVDVASPEDLKAVVLSNDPGDVLSIAKHRYDVRYSPYDLGAVGPPPVDEEATDMMKQSLLEKAGLELRGKRPEADSPKERFPGTRYDLLDDGAGQIKDPNRPV
ncbi:MAG: PDZ domain-containing protein [Chloroflexi bacterium]|nr:PDZ domain-containing protein [Chloroflexota bacterium]